MIVPYAAGGNTDSQARIFAQRLTDVFGQPFVVENKVGAGGAIAADYVARSAPDGYTLFFAASGLYTLPLIQKVNFDPYKDFEPISVIGSNPMVMAVHNSVPVHSVPELVAYVKARPEQLNYATGGVGSLSHLSLALFLARAGLKMMPIHYKGGAQSVPAVVGGQVQMVFGNLSELLPFADGSKVRLLAVTGDKRAAQLPNVPALAEFYPGYDVTTWNGFLAPAGTPKAIVDKLAQEIIKIDHEPAVVKRLNAIGVDAVGSTPEEFAARLRRAAPTWKSAAEAAGIKLQ
jgi:tripartite-type tricarboxylate transporter receptor subunit TctC